MCADNGMNDQSYVDLAEMTQAGSTPEVNIIVEVDRAGFDTLPAPIRYKVKPGALEFLGELPELDMADPASLIDFVRFGKDVYPATNYLLVLWDHGNGWPDSVAENQKSELRSKNPDFLIHNSYFLLPSGPRSLAILYDASSGNSMGVAGGKLREAMNGVKSVLGKKVAILALDACLMQMLEVAYEVKDAADIMVSTPDLMPFNGFPYDTFFRALIARPGISPREYAKMLPDIFIQSYSGGAQGQEPATLSSLDLTKLENAGKSLDAALKSVACQAGSDQMQQARRNVQTYACEYFPPNRFNDNVDLIGLLQLARELAPKEIDRAVLSFQSAVLASANNDTALDGAQGIAVWFPDHYLALKVQHSKYRELQFSQKTTWLHFLNCYFGADDVKPLPPQLRTPQTPIRNSHNDFRLGWTGSADMAPVTYEIRALTGIAPVLADPVENFDHWQSAGFTLANFQGRTTFYSGIGDNLDNRLTLRTPLAIPAGGLFSFQAWFNTREVQDTLRNTDHDVAYVELSADSINWNPLDSLYGSSRQWLECRYFLPGTLPVFAPSRGRYRFSPRKLVVSPFSILWLRFRFKTGSGPHVAGVFIDSVAAYSFSSVREVAAEHPDSSFYVFNETRGACDYAVVAWDSFGNRSYVSNLLRVEIANYAAPYTIPAPVQGRDAVLVLDYPPEEQPEILIFTVSGELVARFAASGPRTPWTTANQQGKPLASGIYLVLVEGKNFRRQGWVAVAR
jgi:hypothetical protein